MRRVERSRERSRCLGSSRQMREAVAGQAYGRRSRARPAWTRRSCGPRLARAIAIAALIVLVITPAAEAKTVRLNWFEKTGSGYGYPSMTFIIKSVTVEGPRWSARASVANRSANAVEVTQGRRSFGDYRFGLIVPRRKNSNCGPQSGPCFPLLLGSQRSRPAFPATLGPGQVWTGSFSGTGALPRGVVISVAFGFFVDPTSKKGFSWITHHSFKL
jgi:hypothetical protein